MNDATLYIYAFAAKKIPTLVYRGIEESPIQYTQKGKVVAIWSYLNNPQELQKNLYSDTQSAALKHYTLLSEIAPTTALLPCKFGTILKNEEDLAQLITNQQDALLALLTQIENCCEYDLKITLTEKAIPQTGTEYLKQKQELLKTHQQIEAELSHLPLQYPEIIKKYVFHKKQDSFLSNSSWLVSNSEEARFLSIIATLQQKNMHWQHSLSVYPFPYKTIQLNFTL